MPSELVALSVLTPVQYGELADVPPELEWLANITNLKTRRAYKRDVEEFSGFSGLRDSAEGGVAKPIARSSAKMYIHRCETELRRIWLKQARDLDPPTLIQRGSRGGREVAYRLLARCEIDHV
jgi:hypothetical protein